MEYLLFPLLIFIIIFVVPFVYLNNRISRLEKRLEEGGVNSAQSATAVSVSTASPASPVANPSIMSSVRSATTTSVPLKSTSSEEAGGRWLGKVGVFALVVGISFFLQYAFSNNLIGPVGRVIIGLFSGVALLSVGQWLRAKYHGYSDLLLGGGIAVLYLTIFSSFMFYHQIGQYTAYFFFGLVTLLSVVMSVIDGTITLAIIGVLGGFLTPYLISNGHDQVVGLFTYYLILDIGVLAVSLWKKWTKLNYVAFVCSAIAICSWIGFYYTDADMPIIMIFTSLISLVFLIAGIIHHVFRKEISVPADIALLTINALGYFAIAYNLLDKDFHAYMGFFALGLALLYVLISLLAYFSNQEDRFLNIALPGIATIFLSIAVPLQLDEGWVSVAWIVEAAFLYLLASVVRHKTIHVFGGTVFIIGVLRHVMFDRWDHVVDLAHFTPFINQNFFTMVLAIVVAYGIARFYSRNTEVKDSMKLAGFYLVVANFLTLYVITSEISLIYNAQMRVAPQDKYGLPTGDYYTLNNSLRNQMNTVISVFWALYAIVLMAVGFIGKTRIFRVLGLGLFFITAMKIFIDVWSLGEVYKIVSSIIFGLIALLGSFLYARFKDRLALFN